MITTKLAFQEEKTPQTTVPSIRGVYVVGGFLDGLRLNFAEGLNCIIGGRGTGKTTVLELIRYALDQIPEGSVERKKFLSLVEENLGGGEIRLDITTPNGLEYRVSRTWNERPIILTPDNAKTRVTLSGGKVFHADIYSQNQIEHIAEDAPSQLVLLDSFERERLASLQTAISQVERDLVSTTGRIQPLQAEIVQLTDEVATLPSVEEKLCQLSQNDADVSEEVNAAHQKKALRDREQRYLEAVSGFYRDLTGKITKISKETACQSASLVDEGALQGPNGQVIRGIYDTLRECDESIQHFMQKIVTHLDEARHQLQQERATLATTHDEQELEFRAILQKHTQAQGQASQRSSLQRTQHDLLFKTRKLKELKEMLDAVITQRKQLMEKLMNLRMQRFGVRQAVVNRINGALEPAIRVSLDEQGDTSVLEKILYKRLSGAKLRHGLVASRIARALDVGMLMEVIAKRDTSILIERAELNPDQATKTLAALCDPTFHFELEAIDVGDRPTIELYDRGTYKSSLHLSTGQKCTCILPILLLKSGAPLLVDQPEDNLDNAFIYNTIVESIQAIKTGRQLIFVTHNPNIPVLGNAEKVFVLGSDENGGRLLQSGTVDHCKQRIIDLLEGGREAFEQRGICYRD